MTPVTTVARAGCGHGDQDVHLGQTWLGTVRAAQAGWLALPDDAPASWHPYERDAVHAVVYAHTGGYLVVPIGGAS